MAVNKRLIGVFIPAPPGGDHFLTQPPLSRTRRAELDATPLTDYSGSTDEDLKALMCERGIGSRGRRKTDHYIKALQAAEVLDRQEYQAWKDNVEVELRAHALAERQSLMFASKYKAYTTRNSFLDLPPNIRNTIYELALFQDEQDPIMKMCYLFDQDRFLTFNREFKCRQSHEDNTILALDMMGAIRKQIRFEVRTCFFTKLRIHLQGKAAFDQLDGHGYVQRFLNKVGPEGRAALAELVISIPDTWPLN